MDKRKKKKDKKRVTSNTKNRARPYIERLKAMGSSGYRQQRIGKSFDYLKSEDDLVISAVLNHAKEAGLNSEQLLGNVFPEDYSSFLQVRYINDANSVYNEIRWLVNQIELYIPELKELLSLRDDFYAAMIKGQLDEAKNFLNKIFDEFGKSIWTVKAELLLSHYEGGLKQTKKTQTRINRETNDLYIKVIAQYFAMVLETHVTSAVYDSAVLDFLGEKIDSEGTAFLALHCYFNKIFQFPDDLQIAILGVAGTYALIDRYDAISHLVRNSFFQGRGNLHQEIVNASRRLANVSQANLFKNIYQIHTGEYSTGKTELSRVIDFYTIGLYQEAQDVASKQIQLNPQQVEYYELLCKSAIHAGEVLSHSDNTPSEKIVKHLSNILQRNINAEDSIAQLRKLACGFAPSQLTNQLNAILNLHARPDVNNTNVTPSIALDIHCSEVTPRCVLESLNHENLEKRISHLSRQPDYSVTTQFFLASESGNIQKIKSLNELPHYRIQKSIAKVLEGQGNYDAALEIYQQLFDDYSNNSLIKIAAITGVTTCLTATERYTRCVDFITNIYFSTPEFFLSINVKKLIDAYDTNTIPPSAPWAVLQAIYYNEILEQRNDKRLFQVSDDFLNSLGANRPSELFEQCETFSKKHFVYFLQHVCRIEVLDSSVEYASTQDIENERLLICKFLREFDEGNADIFSLEIAKLTQTRKIREAISQVDNSKVYVDVSGIVRSLDLSFEDSFERMVSLSRLDSRLRLFLVRQVDGKTIIQKSAATRYNDEVDQIALSLFYILRERYISSNEFGLDSYLSLRVRHGTLSNQIRSVFENSNLVTTRSEESRKYESNLYWIDQLDENDAATIQKIDEIFSEFSECIDTIVDVAKDEWLQIKSDLKPNGLFDFDYASDELNLLVDYLINAENYEHFLRLSFDDLNSRAEKNLEVVRNKIHGELKRELLEVIHTFEAQMPFEQLPDSTCLDLRNEIVTCRTQIQNEVETIASWFETIRDTNVPDFSLDHLIDTCVAIYEGAYAYEGACDTTIENNIELPGSTFTYLVDAIMLILMNSWRHSDESHQNVKIMAQANERSVCITISNRINLSQRDMEELCNMLPQYEDRTRRLVNRGEIRAEGGSGFYKLGRLFNVNLNSLHPVAHLKIFEDDNINRFSVTLSFRLEQSNEVRNS